MLIPPQLRPGVVAPPRPQVRLIRYRIRGFVLLLRVLTLCIHTGAHADKALPPLPAVPPMPGFLEAVAADYANSQPFNAVEGFAPVREPRTVRSDLAPAPPVPPTPQAPPSAAPQLATPPGNIRRVNAQ